MLSFSGSGTNHSWDSEIESAIHRGEDPCFTSVSSTPYCCGDFIIPLWLVKVIAWL